MHGWERGEDVTGKGGMYGCSVCMDWVACVPGEGACMAGSMHGEGACIDRVGCA